ncbi:hypothetical protein FXO38_16857 [Capsicum annuum]|nr:hypothetical protein FXO38_16857 [Capsicum annuum]
MFSGYLGIGDFMSSRKVFDEMGERNVASWNAMINRYVKVDRMREACELFDEMAERNEVSYTIMISGCVGVSEFEEVWRWFVDMRRRGVMPDQKMFLVVLSVVIGLDNVVTLANLVALAMKIGLEDALVPPVYGFEENYEKRTNKMVEMSLQVVRKLMLECDTKKGKNSLLKAGYGGWILYTAASAGDLAFVHDLLERSPLLVFEKSEYGVTDILYAATRSKSCDPFRVLLDFSVTPMFLVRDGGEMDKHIAEVLKEPLADCCDDILVYRDIQGATPLHAAAGKGQVEV